MTAPFPPLQATAVGLFKKPFNMSDADYNSDTEEPEEQELDLSVPDVMTKYKAVA
jgi:hypothetical protein